MPHDSTIVSGSLTRVAEYQRTIAASLSRVWENVRDWEHLPWVHRSSFCGIELLEGGDWGWRAHIDLPPKGSRQQVLVELLIESDRGRYVTRTVEGFGAGTEIWTQLFASSPAATDIRVEFWVPDVVPEAADSIGRLYLDLYGRLWSEDESMMQQREAALVAARAEGATTPARECLGQLDDVRVNLPRVVNFRETPVWIHERDGVWSAWLARCPHRLGPLDKGIINAGVVTCPWHGYRFDLKTGEGCDGRSLRLQPGPAVKVENGQVWLVLPEKV